MLRFKSFLTEAKEDSKAGAVANTNGVRHELLTAGVLNHMSKHYNSSNNPYNGGSHPNLFEMDDKELKNHFDEHVKSGKFSEHHMPEHYRDQDNQTPKAVHDRYTHESLEPEEHYNHFANAVHHAKELHNHLEERGYDPKSLSNVAWTSVDGNVNSYMKKHGENPERKMNKGTDDADVMATIKDKKGNQKPIGLSLKWGSQKNQAPTAKNNTYKTVAPEKEFGAEHSDAIKEYQTNAEKEVKDHESRVKGVYAGSEKVRKHIFDADKNALEKNPDDERLKKNIESVKDSYKTKSQNVAGHLENALNKVKNGPNGHKEISDFVRRKLQIPNPDFVAARAHMTVDKNNKVNGHHFEDHSTSLNDHLNNAHHFDIERNGATLNIHAVDKSGKKLFTHKMWTKHNSRESDGTTKWLHKTSIPAKDKHTTVKEMLDNVMGNNLVESTDVFKSTLSNKIAAKLLEAKKGLYSERFDKNLDKNKNGKLDADDFKKLRASKKQDKCTATCEETVEEGIGSMLGLSTTKGKPDWKKAPKWATHLGRTHEGAFHWLDKNTALTNKSSDSYYPNAGKIKFSGHVDTKKGIGYVEQKPTNEETMKQMEDALNEVLNPSMGVKAYIDDFIKSDDSRFTGDSKEKRRQRAIAAFYNDKK